MTQCSPNFGSNHEFRCCHASLRAEPDRSRQTRRQPSRRNVSGAAMRSPRCCASWIFRISRWCPARAIAGCTTASSTISATARRRWCCAIHEENAVAIAHGYAKVTDRMMAAALHANVGLMRATMAIYNAWCDRAPILILGATGPWDATKRRPWIDWIHTSSRPGRAHPQLHQVGQPAGLAGRRDGSAAARRADRADRAARPGLRQPRSRDAGRQDRRDAGAAGRRALSRRRSRRSPRPNSSPQAAKLLSDAKNPVILAGPLLAQRRRLERARRARRKAQRAGAHQHQARGGVSHRSPPARRRRRVAYLADEARALVASADVILSLDWLDLAGTLKQAFGDEAGRRAKVIQVSCDAHSHRGWSMDHQGLPPVDVYLMCETDAAVPLLLEAVTRAQRAPKLPRARRCCRLPPDAVSLRGVGVGAGSGDARHRRLLHALPARLERRLHAFPPSARLHRPRRRRRRGLRARA